MIRRTFFSLCTGLALPLPRLRAAFSVESTNPAPLLPVGVSPPPPSSPYHPDWLREWRETPKLEVFDNDLPYHNDPYQREIAAVILSHIQTGTSLKFHYHGGSEPGQSRNVLPTWLFYLDNFNYLQFRTEDPAVIPEFAESPLYLHAWCIARKAPRTFRLDRIKLTTDHPMKTTEIAFILDRSGSMESMTNAAIAGFNEFLAAQQVTLDDHGNPMSATFSLILFDHEYLPVHNRQDIQTARPLTAETYVPRGSTALLDAIGRTIDYIGSELAKTPEANRPAKVIIAILTDGEENASQRFTMAEINQRITHQTQKYQWEFLFLGANQDAIATAARMGIHAHQSATFVADADDMAASNQTFSRKISAARRSAIHCDLGEEEATTLKESMSESLEKSRKEKR